MTAWRWSNVPIPETYVGALAAAAATDLVVPLRPRMPGARPLGAGLVVAGIALIGWAVASAGEVNVDRSDRLVQDGAYAITRNPMYLGWSAAILGLALAQRHAWLLLAWAVATGSLHREILQEERRLEALFPAEFRRYRQRVPRYLAGITGTRP